MTLDEVIAKLATTVEMANKAALDMQAARAAMWSEVEAVREQRRLLAGQIQAIDKLLDAGGLSPKRIKELIESYKLIEPLREAAEMAVQGAARERVRVAKMENDTMRLDRMLAAVETLGGSLLKAVSSGKMDDIQELLKEHGPALKKNMPKLLGMVAAMSDSMESEASESEQGESENDSGGEKKPAGRRVGVVR